jgi:hypothetical protein
MHVEESLKSIERNNGGVLVARLPDTPTQRVLSKYEVRLGGNEIVLRLIVLGATPERTPVVDWIAARARSLGIRLFANMTDRCLEWGMTSSQSGINVKGWRLESIGEREYPVK